MYNFSENSKGRMQRFEELHAAREPQFGHPCNTTTYAQNPVGI